MSSAYLELYSVSSCLELVSGLGLGYCNGLSCGGASPGWAGGYWRRVSGVGWWVLASTAGLAGARGGAAALASGNSEVLGSYAWLVAAMALGGAVTGILQWLVLRGMVSRAGWWVLASTVGWALGFAVMDAGAELVGVDCILGALLPGPVLGAVTGGALVWRSLARASAGSGYGRSLSLAVATTPTRSLVGV
jgi:hypothetical protein